MNEGVITDLKQFITATVSQQISGLRDDMDQRFDEVDRRFQRVDQRFEQVNQRFDDLEAKVDAMADAHASDLADHEARLTKLEQQVA